MTNCYFLYYLYCIYPVMSRFAKLRLVTSRNHLYKKLEEYGADHDSVVKEMVDNDGKWLASQKKHNK